MATEWREQDFDFGTRRGVSARLYLLPCGHVLQVAAAFSKESVVRDKEHVLHATRNIQRQLDHAALTHDCAEYEDEMTLQRVTARLQKGLPREALPGE